MSRHTIYSDEIQFSLIKYISYFKFADSSKKLSDVLAEFSGTGPLSKFQPDGVNFLYLFLHLYMTSLFAIKITGYRLRRLQTVHGHLPGNGNAGRVMQEAIPVFCQTDAYQDRVQC